MWHEDGTNDKTKSAPLVGTLPTNGKCDLWAYIMKARPKCAIRETLEDSIESEDSGSLLLLAVLSHTKS